MNLKSPTIRLLFTALSLLISVSVFGQGWEQIFIWERSFYYGGTSVVQDSDNGYVICGSSNNNDVNGVLTKTNSDGLMIWSESYDNNAVDCFFDMSKTQDGGFVLGGLTQGEFFSWNQQSDFYLVKTNEFGTTEWSKVYNGISEGFESCFSVQQTSDEGFILGGKTHINTNGKGFDDDGDILIIKTDNLGNEEWHSAFDLNAGLEANSMSVCQTSDNGYIICGTKRIDVNEPDNYGHADIWLCKINNSGDLEWEKTFGPPGDNLDSWDYGADVKQTPDGGYIICGRSEHGIGNSGGGDALLIRTNHTGQVLWQKFIGGSDSSDTSESLELTDDGGFIVVGQSDNGNPINGGNNGDVYIFKTNESGDVLWEMYYGGEGEDYGFDVKKTAEGGYIICGGYEATISGVYQTYLIKTDSEGTLSSEFTIPTPSPKILDKVVDALGREVNRTTNQILFYIYDDGSVEKKFIFE